MANFCIWKSHYYYEKKESMFVVAKLRVGWFFQSGQNETEGCRQQKSCKPEKGLRNYSELPCAKQLVGSYSPCTCSKHLVRAMTRNKAEL